jgi:hypothetical protein
VQVIEFRGKLIYKVAARRGVLRITAIDGVSGKNRRVAEIFQSPTAIGTIAVYAAHPGNTHACAQGQFGGRSIDNLSHDLVTGDESLFPGGQVSFDDVEVRTAHTAGANAKENITHSRLRLRNLFDPKRLFRGS